MWTAMTAAMVGSLIRLCGACRESVRPTRDIRKLLVHQLALQQARIPVKMHLYAKGGQAFGV
jgi:hypothetical protein